MKRRLRKKCMSSMGYGTRRSQSANAGEHHDADGGRRAAPGRTVQPCSGPEMIA